MNTKTIILGAKNVIKIESDALKQQIKHIDNEFVKAVSLIFGVSGKLVVMGVGKSGLIAKKIVATMSSLGTPSVFLHPAECLHGDIGTLSSQDAVLMLSYTGESDEIKKVLPIIKSFGIKIVAMTGKPKAQVWKSADIIINSCVKKEACHLNIAPTSSTTAMLVLGDAIAICVSKLKGFKVENMAKFHPLGGIGKKLTLRVADLMHKGANNPLVKTESTVEDALFVMTKTRVGATNIVDAKGKLAGFFTDGDLRRNLQKDQQLLSKKISLFMTKKPLTILPQMLAVDAARILKAHKFDNIPVVDKNGKSVGILDERDLLSEGIV